MSMRELAPVLPDSPLWAQFTRMRTQNRLQQATLITIPADVDVASFLDRVLTHWFCLEATAPCGTCSLCARILSDHHPDIQRVHPETQTGMIKIEQIRNLQTYQTPQLGDHQVVVIYPAEAMNSAAASALLKILEEPPPSSLFLLVTTNPAVLLPTILSRCQHIQMQPGGQQSDPLALGASYPETAPRGILYAQRFDLLSKLDDMLARRVSPSTVAEQWSGYALPDGVWFFATLISKLIQIRLLPQAPLQAAYQAYTLFRYPWCPEKLYQQLDGLYAILQQVQQQINLNQALVWERILLNFLEDNTDVN